jgi:hypothetical protein
MPEPTVTPGADPLATVADALSRAAQAAREGAADAQTRVSEMAPAIGGFVSRLTYTTCYAVSYGVVFPTLLVARAVPKDNVIVQGLVEGALAAVAATHKESVAVDSPGSEPHHGLIIPGGDEAV